MHNFIAVARLALEGARAGLTPAPCAIPRVRKCYGSARDQLDNNNIKKETQNDDNNTNNTTNNNNNN